MDYGLNHENNCEDVPLHELIKRGININAKREDGTNRLQNAIEDGNMEETCMLLYYGADVNIPNKFNQKVINIALNNYNLNIALVLMNFCNDLNSTSIYSTYIALLSKKSALSRRLLMYTNAEEILVKYFKLFSSKIHKELVFNNQVRFLADFLMSCDYSGSKFLDCLNTILKFPKSQLLLQKFKRKYSTQNFHNLLNALTEKNIKRKDRIATIWSWMGLLGGDINIMNINVAFYLFGYNEEVEALIYTTGPIKVCCLRILPLTIFTLALEEEMNTVKSFETFLGYWYNQGMPELITFSRREIDFNAKQIVLNSLLYFTIPDHIKKVFFKEFKNTPLYCMEIVQVIKRLPRIPKLIELSRDKSRRYIKEAYNIKEPYQFQEAVKKLNLPSTVRDIIRFKRPIYY